MGARGGVGDGGAGGLLLVGPVGPALWGPLCLSSPGAGALWFSSSFRLCSHTRKHGVRPINKEVHHPVFYYVLLVVALSVIVHGRGSFNFLSCSID